MTPAMATIMKPPGVLHRNSAWVCAAKPHFQEYHIVTIHCLRDLIGRQLTNI